MSNESLNKSQETVNKYLTLAKDDLARLKHILTKFGEYSGLLPEQMGEIEILDRIRESFHSAIRELVADNEAKDRRIAELENAIKAIAHGRCGIKWLAGDNPFYAVTDARHCACKHTLSEAILCLIVFSTSPKREKEDSDE
jgi:hypothetical protein